LGAFQTSGLVHFDVMIHSSIDPRRMAYPSRLLRRSPGRRRDRYGGTRAMPQIEITRGSALVDATRAYSVYVNGVNSVQIRDGETKVIGVDEGDHVIQCLVDWKGSPKFRIKVGSDGIKLFCKSNDRAQMFDSAGYILLWEGDAKDVVNKNITQITNTNAGTGVPDGCISAVVFFVYFLFVTLATERFHMKLWVALCIGLAWLGILGFIRWRVRSIRMGQPRK
jgi:hypothetical protein